MRSFLRITAFLLLLIANALEGHTLEMMWGQVWNMPEDLTIKQDGQADITINQAQLQTKPFTVPHYYSLRYAYETNDDTAWELEINHMKLYLDTLPAEVQKFELSHGFNHLWLNRAWIQPDFIFHFGAGFVLAHPDIIVRNQTNYLSGKEGYTLCGGSIQASLQKKFDLNRHWFVSLEAKLVYALTRIPIANGSVVVPNRSVHADAGLGYTF